MVLLCMWVMYMLGDDAGSLSLSVILFVLERGVSNAGGWLGISIVE